MVSTIFHYLSLFAIEQKWIRLPVIFHQSAHMFLNSPSIHGGTSSAVYYREKVSYAVKTKNRKCID